MAPGRDRLVVEPSAVTRDVVLRLSAVTEPAPIIGHGPHPLPFGTAQSATWREPDSQSAPRTPDSWTFELAGDANVTLKLADAMTGALRRDGADGTAQRIVGQWQGTLQAGRYTLDITSLGRNDRTPYTVTLNTVELQPDTPRSVSLPATLPFAIASPRVVSLTSFGSVPVKAVLRGADGGVIGRYAARADDWNVAVSRPLPAGSYKLELLPAAAPNSNDTTLRDAPAAPDASNADGGGDDRGRRPGRANPGKPDGQRPARHHRGDPAATTTPTRRKSKSGSRCRRRSQQRRLPPRRRRSPARACMSCPCLAAAIGQPACRPGPIRRGSRAAAGAAGRVRLANHFD